MTEVEMAVWHHRLYAHEFEQALGDSEGQGSLVLCCQWGHKESEITEQLNSKIGVSNLDRKKLLHQTVQILKEF